MQVQFLGGVDEDWFFMGSIGVELAGAPLLPLIHRAAIESRRDDDSALAKTLMRIANGLESVLKALNRMREWSDPHIFYSDWHEKRNPSRRVLIPSRQTYSAAPEFARCARRSVLPASGTSRRE